MVNKNVTGFLGILKTSLFKFFNRDPFRDSTVIAYYTIFSMPGLLVIIINLAGYFFGYEAVTNQISSEVKSMIGTEQAEYIENIVANASEHNGFTWSSVMGIATMLFGATGVFYQLQRTLNLMWEVEPEAKSKILKLVMDRVFSFGLILAVGFLLLVSLVVSTMLSALSDWFAAYLSMKLNIVFRFLDILLSLSVITFLFAAIFKFLPDAEVRWKDVWVGALVTSGLFVCAKILLGFYFSHSDPGSTYGAAGTVIVIMLWVTYAGMILLFGAEFTKVYAERNGATIIPSEFARRVEPAPEQTKKCAESDDAALSTDQSPSAMRSTEASSDSDSKKTDEH